MPHFFHLLVLLFISTSCLQANDWLGWRHDGTGVADGTAIISWSEEDHLLWRAQVPGDGHSSPIIKDDRVFVTSAVDSDQKLLRKAAFLTYWALGLCIALWFIAPLSRGPTENSDPLPLSARALTALALAIYNYVLLSLLKWTFWRFPDISDDLSDPYELFFGFFYKDGIGIKWAGLYLVVTCLLLLGFWIWRAWRQKTDKPNLAQWLDALFLGSLFLLFFLHLSTYVLVPRDPEVNMRVWMKIAGISLLGLGLAFAGLDRRSRLNFLGAPILISLLVMGYFLQDSPLVGLDFFRKLALATYAGLAIMATTYYAFRANYLKRSTPLHNRMNFGFLTTTILMTFFFVISNYVLPVTKVEATLFCFDAKQGTLLWQTTLTKAPVRGLHPANSPATPTPVTDGSLVYASFGDMGTFAVDYQGQLVWENKDPVPLIHWGMASSPILWENLLIMTLDTDHLNYTRALDKATGKKVWRKDMIWPEDIKWTSLDGYSTPIIHKMDQGEQLIHFRTGIIAGHDPATGEELWRWPNGGWQIIASPVAKDNLIVAACGAHVPDFLSVLSLDEQGKNPTEVWLNREEPPGTCSPLIVGDRLFTVGDDGYASLQDLATGDVLWQETLPDDEYWSAPLATDQHIYVTGRSGTTAVLAISDQFQLLHVNKLNEKLSSSPAIANGKFFIRGENTLYCFGE